MYDYEALEGSFMRKGYQSGASRRINKRAILLTIGAVLLLVLLFFASFWITSAILKHGQNIPIPQQSDVTSPEESPSKVPEKIEPEKDEEIESQITDDGWGYVEPKKTEEEKKPEVAQKPDEEKKPIEEKKTEQPSALKEPEKPVVPEVPKAPESPKTPEPPVTPVAPPKPSIEILPPNVTE